MEGSNETLRQKSHTKTHHLFPFPSFTPRFFLFFLTALFCLPGTTVLWGQETRYRIEEGGRFIQHLEWEEQENVLYYEIEIEKQAEESWEGALTRKLELTFLEVSLPPGIYRYRVKFYDLLERPVTVADWLQFEVFPAKQPVLFGFSPEAFYLDEDLSWVLDLFGRDLVDGLELVLQGPQQLLLRPDTVMVGPEEDEVRLSFNYEQLAIGDYIIHVVNPGGLETELGTFRIGFKKPVDINVSAGYRPLVSLYGQINELFETGFFPLGAYSRLGIIPFKRLWGYIGFELEPSWNYLVVRREDYTIKAHMFGAAVYGVYQYWLSNRVMAFDFRIGGGLYSVLDYHFAFNRGRTEPLLVLVPAITLGASFQWFVKKPFFLEFGLDFAHFFTVDNPSPAYLRPFAGAGWRF
jgi:hypothetical protein